MWLCLDVDRGQIRKVSKKRQETILDGLSFCWKKLSDNKRGYPSTILFLQSDAHLRASEEPSWKTPKNPITVN